MCVWSINGLGKWKQNHKELTDIMNSTKGVFKGGVQGVQTPPEIFRFFFKSEGKEIESKRKKRDVGGGGLPLNIFLGLIFF